MVPSPQRSVSLICTATYSAIISTLPPPSSAGVTKKPSDRMKTSSARADQAGARERQEHHAEGLAAQAPRLRAAATSPASMPRMLA